MHIRRLLEPVDLPEAADAAAAGLCDEQLTAAICPRRHEYYDDYRSTFQRRVTERFYRGYVLWVAVTDGEDVDAGGKGKGGGGGRIVGYAAWERTGKGEEARRWRDRGGWWMNVWYGQYLTFSFPLFYSDLYMIRGCNIYAYPV